MRETERAENPGIPQPRKLTGNALVLFCAICVLYVGTYVILSANGAYQPEWVDLRGVRAYSWAPAGFYDADRPWKGSIAARAGSTKCGGWNKTLGLAFYPLWRIDSHYVHRPR
jgi:hypothetical protein